jgi:glycosyltransferase involved in cell wall biosynthesis
MRILSANKFYYVYGGSDRYFFELNKLHEQAGHEVIPFAMKHPRNIPSPYSKYFVSEVNYWDNPTPLEKLQAAGRVLYSSEARRKISEIIDQTHPDIAHIHLIYHQISPSFLPDLRKKSIPIIQTLHDYKPICPTYSMVANNEICERCKGKHFYHATLLRCNHGSFIGSALSSTEMYLHHALRYYDLPDIYIAPSDFMRKKMIQYGIPAKKLVHVPNFIDINYAFEEKNIKKKQFIYVGRLVHIKGLSTLLDAMKILGLSDYRLIIVGDGPERPALENYIKKHNITNIEFVGYKNKDEVNQLLTQSQFSILPSIVYENCPLSILESMAVGTPVIGSRIGGIPELINDGVDGFLFEPKNPEDLAKKMFIMLSNSRATIEMGRIAKLKVKQKYNPEIHYEKIIAIYDKLLS